jgi:hypothetical protein
VTNLIKTLKQENITIYENMKEYFKSNPKVKTENKQVDTFISILKLLIKNIEEHLDINNSEERKHIVILEALFNDFCEHLNINSISVN